MNFKRQIGTLGALLAGSVALAAPAMSAPQDRISDAHDRAVASGEAAVAYFRANELATLPTSSRDTTVASGESAVAYFRANELATLPTSSGAHTLRSYLDGPKRGDVSQTGPSEIVAIPEDGFDWRAAAIGASSALMLFLVAVVGVVAARHPRVRPFAH